jgi:putative ABC transport system substrate-binding protein
MAGGGMPMLRRGFIAGLGSAAAFPQVAHAQQAVPVVGFIHGGTAAPFANQLQAFNRGLQEGGYTVGQNVAIEYRWAEGDVARLPALAAELVNRRVNVIASVGGPPSNLAAKAATTTIPVVFNTGADPLKMGLVTSMNRPGGNVTGVTFFSEELGSKGLHLLHEIVPAAKTIGMLVNPSNTETARRTEDLLAAARVLKLATEIAKAATPSEIDTAFAALTERRIEALLIFADAFYGGRIEQLVQLTSRYRLPAMFYRREFPDAGGLVSYGTSIVDSYRQTGGYVARVLKGDKPGDLPVMQASKFEFVINLKVARSLGLDIPGAITARADDIIE